MALEMILTGDVNLMNVTDPRTPFARIAEELRGADVVFGNLECCLVDPPAGHSLSNEGFFADYKEGIAGLRPRVDVLVAPSHWSLGKDVLQYMAEIAHGAIDAGADIVVGHGPHYSLPIEVYKGKPIFYGLGNFSFHTGHGGRRHGDWIGTLARCEIARSDVTDARFRFVRHNAANETVLCPLADESITFGRLSERSARLGATLTAEGDWVRIGL